MDEVYHSGQLAVQKITGEEELAQGRIPMIIDSLHEKSIPFIEHQILAFLGSEDTNGALWLSLIVGERGFIHVPSIQEVKFDLSKITSSQEDIFFENIKTNPTVGLLFHEAARRARYRARGMAHKEEGQLSFKIRMGYKSCPKHIQREKIEIPENATAVSATQEKGTILTEIEKEWIVNTHTFFVATQTKKGDIEASHKGGDPGFIQIQKDGILRIPDYFGNSIYSTLGNIYENPKAALLFVDYTKGEILQLTGVAKIEFDQNSDEDMRTSGDTGRFWTFETQQWIKTIDHHKASTEFVDFSRYNILTKK